MIDNFIEELNAEIYGIVRNATLGFSQNGRMVLGGSTGPDGGSGVPPGGFIGQLTQGNVAYDTTEAVASGGASSLVDNLNHIRYNIAVLSGGVVTSGVGTDINAIHTNVSGEINLIDTKAIPIGGDIIVIEDSADSFVKKKIYVSTLSGGGGGGDASLITYSPAVLGDWDGDVDPGNVDAALDQLAERTEDIESNISHEHVYQENYSAACNGTKVNFITANEFEPETTVVWLNGSLQEPEGGDYNEDGTYDAITFTVAPFSTDTLLIAYITA